MGLLVGSPDGLELTILTKIRDTLLSVPLISDWVNVYARERFPGTDIEERQLAVKIDPINVELSFMSIIQIGIPTVKESNYTSEGMTQLDFVYPITFDLDVHDTWASDVVLWNPSMPLEFSDSRTLAMMVYMRARYAFKQDRDFGFGNVVHDLLQQEGATIVEDEETRRMIHAIDWSLTVHVTGTVS